MRKAILTISFILSFFAVQAQEAKALFDSIPESILPLLSSVNRADFIDFLESKMKAEVKNKFEGTSEMTDLTDDYIRIKLTERTTWEMKVLPQNDSTKIVCVVSTACGPVCDSRVSFFTTNWKKIPVSDYIEFPVMDDYFQLTDSARLDDYTIYRNKMDMLLATAALSKEADTLTFTLTTPQYAGNRNDDEEKEITDVEAFLRKPLVYVWEYDPFKGASVFKRKD